MSALRHALTVLLMSVLLAGCQLDEADTPEPGTPEVLSQQKTACEKSGGRWGAVPGRSTFTCFYMTKDANTSCSTSSDCEGLCLARSRTCAPITPLYGCHDVISSSGLRQTRCIE